jgi:glutamyl-tRNA reductase
MNKLAKELQHKYIRKKPFQKELHLVKTRALDITTSEESKLVCPRLTRKGISNAHLVNREQKRLSRVLRAQQIESVLTYTSVSK